MSGERLESQFALPSSQSVNVANGGQTAAQTITPTATTWFMTALLTSLQSSLNDNVQGYPKTAAMMGAAVGYGTWTGGAGYLCNDASGGLVSTYGSPGTLTENGTPLYSITGPKGGIDKAIGFDATTEYFRGTSSPSGDFDVAANDLLVATVFKYTATPSVDRALISKVSGAFADGWAIGTNSTDLFLQSKQTAGSLRATTLAFSNIVVGEWYALLAYIDRAGASMRIGIQRLSTGTQTLSSSTNPTSDNFTTISEFRLGSSAWVGTDTAFNLAAAYVNAGSGIATGLTANFSTALAAWAATINASWSCAVSSTGQVALSYTSSGSGIPSWSWDFTTTTFRDLLGFARSINYPTTAAELAAMVGYGTYSAAWLMNETSSPLAPVFGSPSLTHTNGTPIWGRVGPRGGVDKVVALTAGAATIFSGGDVYDVVAAHDLVVLWVAKHTALPAAARIFVGKDNVGSNRWFVEFLDTSQMRTDCGDGTDNVTTTIASPTLNSWYVGALVLERATNKMRCGWCPFGGPPTVSSEIDASLVGDITGAGNLVFGSSFGIDGCENMDTAFLAIGVGASYATGMSANLSTALSNFAATFAATQTGTYAATGVWASGAPLAADTDPKQAPKGDDGVATIGPTGKVYGLVGNFYRRHRNLRFQYVAKNRVWSADATYGEDYETWYLETQRGQHSWFSAFSPINVYWDNAGTATLLGNGVVTAGWKMPKPATLDEIELPVKGWTGLVNVNLGDLYAEV